MTKTTKQRVLDLARRLRVVVDQGKSGDGLMEVVVSAPRGFVWARVGVHELVTCQDFEDSAENVWNAMLKDLDPGLEQCDSPDCDICQP